MRLLLAPLCLLATPMAPSHADEGAVPQTAAPSPAVIKMRRQWLNPEIDSFTFRDTARMFDTRLVKHQGAVQPLPRAAGFTMPILTMDGQSLGYDAVAERTYTNAFLVIRDGKILFEEYRNRSDAQTHFISFSMAKSITSLLIGIALEKGLIKSLDDPVTTYLPELKGGGYDGVTLRHILQMRSGVDYDERYDFGDKPSPAAQNHDNAIVLNKLRFADAARAIGHKWEQGSHFNYATIDTAVLGWTLERATKQPLAAFTQANLWGPAGMEGDGYWIADGPQGVGRELSGMGYNALLRDYGRLGLLMLNGGKRGAAQIIPKGWMTQATTMLPFDKPTPEGFRGYGFQFWQVDGEPGAYAAVGLAGQLIYVHPATKTVIVKLSYLPQGAPPELMADIMRYFKAITQQPTAK
jgi:CubicO group peptidase (beta-lactamase class C family)